MTSSKMDSKMRVGPKNRSFFPDPMTADESGVLTVGGELTPEVLWDAYYHGIFPWPHENYPLLWFFPKERGILEFEDLHIPKSLQKLSRKVPYSYSHSEAFEDVIGFCAHVPRKGQAGTWITPEMKRAYLKFHKKGFAHSFECWEGRNLIGGLYGVFVEGVFSGESMFGLRDNVTKLILWHTVKELTKWGLDWMDIQMLTPVTKQMGGTYVSRKEFLKKLARSHKVIQT